MDNFVTVRGETTEEAIEKGLQELGISREEASIHIITEGKRGLFGFGKQDAVVEVRREREISLSDLTAELEEKHLKQEEVKTTSQEDTTDKSAGEDHTTEEKLTEDAMDRVDDEAAKVDLSQTEEAVETEDVEETFDDLEGSSQAVARYLEAVINEYGAEVEIQIEETDRDLIFNIETDKSGLVIGKHGKIINSLQVLAQTLFQQQYSQRMNIILNVGDYRDRRANVLQEMAERAADEAIRTKSFVKLNALPAYERKQVHAHLAKYDEIQTHSEGKEPNRFLVVSYVEK